MHNHYNLGSWAEYSVQFMTWTHCENAVRAKEWLRGGWGKYLPWALDKAHPIPWSSHVSTLNCRLAHLYTKFPPLWNKGLAKLTDKDWPRQKLHNLIRNLSQYYCNCWQSRIYRFCQYAKSLSNVPIHQTDYCNFQCVGCVLRNV